jgi:hypothetical protein
MLNLPFDLLVKIGVEVTHEFLSGQERDAHPHHHSMANSHPSDPDEPN